MIEKMVCVLRGHFYRPVCEYRFRAKNLNPGTPHHSQRRRYTCERCGEKTKWMSSKEHKVFEKTACPTWGNPGSDSQGYRSDHA